MTLVSDYQRRSISQSLFFRLLRVHHCQHQWTTSLWECFHLLHSLLLYSSFSTVCGNLEKIKAVPIMIIPGFLLEESCILVRIFFLSTIDIFFSLHNFLFPVTSRNSENTTATTTTIPLVPNPLYHDLEGCYSIARSQIEVKFLLASGQFGKVFKGR